MCTLTTVQYLLYISPTVFASVCIRFLVTEKLGILRTLMSDASAVFVVSVEDVSSFLVPLTAAANKSLEHD